jgi:hypothetical protein
MARKRARPRRMTATPPPYRRRSWNRSARRRRRFAMQDPPTLDGQLLHFNESPNRFGLPAFYELHVWAWRDNPLGTFADWNARVSCDGK